MKIIVTNWINLLGVFLAALFYTIIYNYIIDDGVTRTFYQSIFSAILLICLYGFIFILGFTLALVLLDLILIVPNRNRLTLKLFAEWLLISLPFMYWAFMYERQRGIYVIAIIAFFITQLVRKRLIIKAQAGASVSHVS